MMQIRVPATTANLGPGFDSLGLAVSLYLTVTVLESTEKWEVEHNFEKITHDKSNLIVKTALKIKHNLAPHRIKVESDIPLARGLGSSSAAIVAGIELANQLGNLNLTKEQILKEAVLIEGHPDNVAPAVLGDFVTCSYVDGKLNFIKGRFFDISLLAYVPNFELKTRTSRKLLPKELSYKDATSAGAIGNVLVAAIFSGDLKLAGEMMEKDLYHERYRKELIPHLEILKSIKAIATYLSGAGPTVMTIISVKEIDDFAKEAREKGLDGKFIILHVDRKGVQITNN